MQAYPETLVADTDVLGLEVTTVCNNTACNYCFALAALPEYGHMSPELAESAVREGFALGYRRVQLTGGEPLLWPAGEALTRLALDLGYQQVYINTNAQKLPAWLLRLPNSARNRIQCSVTLNGPPAIHALSRGDSHAKVVKGIESLLDQGIRVRVLRS